MFGTMRRRLLPRLVLLLATAALVETLCLLVLTRTDAGAAAPPQDWRAYIDGITDEEIEEFARIRFDPELGWDTPPNREATSDLWSYSTDANGSRRLPAAVPARADGLIVASYGDSFTFGNEVEDGETFQAFLSEFTGAVVLNYGVPGYGTAQALLKLERHVAQGRHPDVVILGLTSTLRRLWNSYVPFMVPETRIRLGFKPLLVEESEGYALLPNPLQWLNGRGDVLAALEEAKRTDRFHRERVQPASFPYAIAAVRLLLDRMAERASPHRSRPNWRDEATTRRLVYLLERFERLSVEAGFVPVIVLLPGKQELRKQLAGEPRAYEPFLDEMRRAFRGTDMVFVDVLEEEFDPEGFHERFGHASARGNRVTARAIQRQAAASFAPRGARAKRESKAPRP